MALQEPAWRVKARPCPFYQHGRCLFADSCNFLHTVSVRPSRGVTIIDSPRKFEQAVTRASSVPPIVTVDAPHSVASSPRSPRLSGLLHALRDVIGDDPEAVTLGATLEVSRDARNTDLTETCGKPIVTEAQDDYATPEQEADVDDTSPTITFSDSRAIHSRVASVINGSPLHSAEDDVADQDGAEDIKPMIRPLSPTHNYSGMLPESPPEYAPKRASHRRSTSIPGINRLSLNRPPHLQLDSLVPPEIDSEAKDKEVFIDSGYAESWQPLSALSLTSPRTPIHSSTLDLLASPFRSPSDRMHSPAGILGRLSLQSAIEDDSVSEISLDCAADCTSPRHEPQNPVLDGIQLSVMDDDVAKNDVCQSSSIAASPAATSLGTEPGEGAEVPNMRTSHILGPPPTSKAVTASTASELSTLPRPSPYRDDDKQLGSSAIYAEHASGVWGKESTPHLGVSPGSPEFSDTSIHRADENTSSLHALETTAAAVIDFDSVSHDHTPNLTEDVGDDDNASSRSSHSSTHLAYDAYSHVTSPPGDAEYSSMLLPLESSPPSFRSSFSDISSFNALSPEQVITASVGAQKLAQTSSSSTLSPVESIAFSSPQDRDAFTSAQSPCADSSRSSTSSSASDSRKVSFGWKCSAKPQSRSPLSNRANIRSPRKSTDTFSGLNFSSENRPDSTSSIYDTISGLRALRLSTSSQHISFKSSSRSSDGSTTSRFRSSNRTSISSSVSSTKSQFNNLMPSPARISSIPEHTRNSILTSQESIPSPLSDYSLHLKNFGEPRSAPVSPNTSWYPGTSRHHYESMTFERAPSRASEPGLYRIEEQEDVYVEEATNHQVAQIIRCSSPSVSRRSSIMVPAVHAIATPRPTLFFAIASDKVDEVRKVLESGHAGPNEAIGPQSALEFALTNDQLTHKMEIVKLLLAFGANPSVARNQVEKRKPTDVDSQPTSPTEFTPEDKMEVAPEPTPSPVVKTTILDAVDVATRYYVEKAEAPDTRRVSALMHRSSFRALTRVRYEIVGQDRALEQLFRVLSIHTRHLSATPIVVLLCGPSGHGKSLLARKFGSLLDVPTHTVNMTTLKSTHDLWKSYSMSPYETPTTCTLAEFLVNNEGKRCVVVLDEIEKTEDEKALWSLLMPWELGRCSIDAGSRHVDVRNVVWLGTSNVGHDMIVKYQEARNRPQEPFYQEEYAELMGLLRPKVSERLGASVLSRVTTVLPFVPFTVMEKKAICSEALYTLAGEAVRELSPQAVEKIIDVALASYCPEEGARSLYRAISSHLVDII